MPCDHDNAEDEARSLPSNPYERLLRYSPEPIVLLDAKGGLSEVNDAFMRIVGRDRRALIAKPFAEFVHPEDREQIADLITGGSLAVGSVVGHRSRLIAKDGRSRWIDWTLATDGQGNTFVSGRDSTDSQRDEYLASLKLQVVGLYRASITLDKSTLELLRILLDAVGSRCGGIYILKDYPKRLELLAHLGVSTGFAEAVARISSSDPWFERIGSGSPVITSSKELDDVAAESLAAERLESIGVWPLTYRGNVVGAMTVGFFDPKGPDEERIPVFEQLVNFAVPFMADLVVRSEQEELESALATVLEHANDIVFLCTDDCEIIRANKACVDRLTGTSHGRLSELLRREAWETLRKLFSDAIAQNKTIEADTTLPLDGVPHRVRITVIPVLDPAGSYTSVGSIIIDLEAYHRVQDRLQAMLDFARVAEDAARTGFVSFNPDTGELEMSDTCARILGFAGKTPTTLAEYLECIHPDDRQAVQVVAQVSPQDRLLKEVEYRVCHPGRDPIWIHTRGSVVENPLDGTLRGFGVVQDITERKRIDRELQVLQVAINASMAGVAVMGTDGRLEYANHAFKALAKKAGEKRDWSPFWNKLIAEHLAVERKGGRSDGGQWEGEVTVTRADGKSMYLHVNLTAVDEPVEPGGVVMVMTDVTEVRMTQMKTEKAVAEYSERLEEAVEERTRSLREAQERLLLTERLAVLGQLSGSISHELRNPLAAIRNAVYLITREIGGADEKLRRHIEIVAQQAERAAKTVTDLLDFSRAKPARLERVDLADLLRDCVRTMDVPSGIAVKLVTSQDQIAASADSELLQHIVENLVSNACDAIGTDGAITIEAAKMEGRAVVRVADTGSGISDDVMSRIFEPLVTTKNHGVGLGMAIVKSAVEQMNGEIDIETRQGVGTTVSVYLKLMEESPP
jgi:PAS domain S-box-containing protein